MRMLKLVVLVLLILFQSKDGDNSHDKEEYSQQLSSGSAAYNELNNYNNSILTGLLASMTFGSISAVGNSRSLISPNDNSKKKNNSVARLKKSIMRLEARIDELIMAWLAHRRALGMAPPKEYTTKMIESVMSTSPSKINQSFWDALSTYQHQQMMIN